MSTPLTGVRAVICDLDGVVYRGASAIPHAVEALNAAAEGRAVVYATNNAARPPADVAAHLQRLGVRTDAAGVVSSAMAGARVVKAELERRGAEGPVLAVGGEGVALALEAQGLAVVRQGDDENPPVAVMQGYGPDTPYSAFAEASYAIQRGAFWCLTNADRTIPTARGIAPGNGMGGAAVAAATGATPTVAGKPETPIYELALATTGAEAGESLAVGDRLDTDIEGAVRLGVPGLLVLTGVHDVPDVAAAPQPMRPRYLLGDLRGLAEEYLEAGVVDGAGECGAASARLDDSRLVAAGGSPVEQARAVVALGWALVDDGTLDEKSVRRACPSWDELRGRQA